MCVNGGDMISASPLYGEWVDFQPIGKIFLTTNNRPEIRGSDDGIWRRMVEIRYERQFAADEQDKELMAALKYKYKKDFNLAYPRAYEAEKNMGGLLKLMLTWKTRNLFL